MAEVSASSTTTVTTGPGRTLDAVSDYRDVRPRILTEAYHDYRLVSGGRGDGTVAAWTLQATRRRSRQVEATVTVHGSTVTETDARSTLVTHWRVEPVGGGDGSRVTVTSTWQGAGGVGGFFERLFAPRGMQRIHSAVLANLAHELG